MCDNMLYELAEEAKREISKYSDNYEIYLENTELLQLDSQKTDLNFAKEEISLGIGIRVIKDGSVGFAFTSDMGEIAKTCENAYLNSKLNSKDENFSFAQVEKLPKINGTFDKKFQEIDLDELTSSLKAVLNCIEDNGCQTKMVIWQLLMTLFPHVFMIWMESNWLKTYVIWQSPHWMESILKLQTRMSYWIIMQ